MSDDNSARLEAAISEGDLETLRNLLKAEPDLAARPTPSAPSPILLAAYTGNTDALEILRGARSRLSAYEAAALGDEAALSASLTADTGELERHSADGWTPLHLAAFTGHAATCAQLLDAGASHAMRSTNAMANTPLHAALAGGGRIEVVTCLVEAGADVNATAASGVTPLHLAASRGDPELVRYLLASGALRRTMDDDRWPEDLADERGHPQVAALIRETSPPPEG